MTETFAPSNVLRDHGSHPFTPGDVARAVLLADEGLYEQVVAAHHADALHDAGAWHLLGEQTWTPAAAQAAHALRALLAPVGHPLAGVAIAALSEGIALAEATAPLCAEEPADEAAPAHTRHAA